MINFPDSPTAGTIYSPGASGPTWRYDGQKWVGVITGYLPTSGGAITGPLTVAGLLRVNASIGVNQAAPADNSDPGLFSLNVYLNGGALGFGIYVGTSGGASWKRLTASPGGLIYVNPTTASIEFITSTAGTVGSVAAISKVAEFTPAGMLYLYGAAVPINSTNEARFSARRWFFKQNPGDDGAAGAIDYRGYDVNALSIVGAGVGTSRKIVLWDNATVTGALTVLGDASSTNLNVSTTINAANLNVANNLDVNGRAALLQIDLGDTQGVRKGYFDGASGNGALDGSLNLGYHLDMSGTVTIRQRGAGAYFQLYDDGNAHIESNTTLWINANTLPVIIGQDLYVQRTVYATGDIVATQSLYTRSTGDAGASSTQGFFSGRMWRFRQNAGDEGSAGSMGYRNHDPNSLSIVGAGTSGGGPRNVRIYDDLYITSHLASVNNIDSYGWVTCHYGASVVHMYHDGNAHLRSNTDLYLNYGTGTHVIVSNFLYVENNRLFVRGYNGPGISMFNWSGGGPFGMWNNSGELRLGVSDSGGGLSSIILGLSPYNQVYLSDSRLTVYGGNSSYGVEVLTAVGRHARVYTDSNGVRGHSIGTWTSGQWVVYDHTAGSNRIVIDGNGFCYNGTGSWSSLSSRDVKQNIKPYIRGLEAIRHLNPITFEYKAGTPFAGRNEPSQTMIGLVADEVAPHLPEIVGRVMALTNDGKEDKLEFDTLQPGNIIYALINSVKELAAEIQQLKAGARDNA